MNIYEDFQSFDRLNPHLNPHWNTYTLGTGTLEAAGHALRLASTNTTSRQTSNAQIDDYQDLPRHRFRWRPPLTMTVCARFSHPATGMGDRAPLRGTAGFGFWNDPFLMTGRRWPTLPRAIWFFYASPPSNMKLDLGTPGCGWKAATIDALHLRALLLAPIAPPACLLMNLGPLYRLLWPRIQRVLKVHEASLQVDMTDWHTYVIEWGVRATHLEVDGQTVLACRAPPRGPLGFVMWLDNQYLVATPWGRYRYGWLETPGRQWLEVDWLSIEAR